MKKLMICLMASFFLIGCLDLNSNSKGRETEEISEDTEEITRAQDSADTLEMPNGPHLKFRKVPIDGPLDQFVAQMVKSGFSIEEKSNDHALLSGDFADYKECLVSVATLDNKDLVYKINVRFPIREDWESLYGDYKHLKELLTEKYGEPSSCVEKIQDLLVIISKNIKLHNVYSDNCRYKTCFTTDQGEVVLWIGFEDYDAFVLLSYEDKINGSSIKKHALDEL